MRFKRIFEVGGLLAGASLLIAGCVEQGSLTIKTPSNGLPM